MKAQATQMESMPGKLSPEPSTVTRSIAVGARSRAHRRSSWATSKTPSRVLARHYGVSASRVRHFRSDDLSGPLTTLLGMIADPKVEAGPIVAALLAAFEERFIHQPTDDLRARLKHLREVAEHRLQAEQDKALMVWDGSSDACLNHAAVLIELATLTEVLGA